MLDVLFFTSRAGNVAYFDLAVKELTKHDITCKNIYHKDMAYIKALFVKKWSIFKIPYKSIVSIFLYRLNEKKALGILPFSYTASLFWYYIPYYCWIFIIYRANLQMHPSKYVGVWNGYKYRMAIIATATQNLGRQILYFEGGLLPQTTRVDTLDVITCASIPKNFNFYKKNRFHQKLAPCPKLEIIPRKKTPNFQKMKQVFVDLHTLPDKYYFAPFQQEDDASLIIHSPNIKSMKQFCNWLDVALKEMPQDYWIVMKRHPSEKKNFNFILKKYKHSRIIFSDLSTDFLIAQSMGVITINSTVGMEALLLNKPVYLLGDAPYGIEGLVSLCNTPEDIAKNITNKKNFIDQQALNSFFSYLYHCYSLPDSYEKTTKSHWQVLANKVKNDFTQ
jgi:capsular polysaccharide export protein